MCLSFLALSCLPPHSILSHRVHCPSPARTPTPPPPNFFPVPRRFVKTKLQLFDMGKAGPITVARETIKSDGAWGGAVGVPLCCRKVHFILID